MNSSTSLAKVPTSPCRPGNSVRLSLAVIALLALAVDRMHAQSVVNVSIFSNGYDPNDLTINVGTTVRWINNSGFHTTTADPGQLEFWDSGFLGQGQTFDHTFNNLGTFEYYCSLHSFPEGTFMNASITVVPEPSTWALGLIGAALASAFYFRRGRTAR